MRVQNRRDHNNKPRDEGWEANKDELCQYGAEWVGHYGIQQRLIQ